MSEWYESRAGLWRMGWAQLTRATDPRAPERFVTLASVNADNAPEQRTVVLRRADPQSAEVDIHTDATSLKIKDFTANPNAALLHWIEDLSLQIRLNGRITITTGAPIRETWDTLPKASFASYGVTPPPGTEIPTSDAYERVPKFEQFAVLTLTIERADIVHLSRDYHRRARFDRTNDWAGQWLAP